MKKRVNFTLSAKAIQRLEALKKEAEKVYGKQSQKAKKSPIVEQLILDTRDPMEKIDAQRRELGLKITELNKQMTRLDKIKETLGERK